MRYRGKSLVPDLNDSICSDEEFAEAVLLGDWITGEFEGVETIISQYNGKYYFLDQKVSRGLKRF